MFTVVFPPSNWDPYGTLGLNPNETVTCIGRVKTKKRECHNPISKDSRAKACHILNQLSTQTQNLDHLLPQLKNLAKLLLCKKSHQSQVYEIVQYWQSNLTLTVLTPPPSPTSEVSRNRLGNDT
jgi:hypothetical protein